MRCQSDSIGAAQPSWRRESTGSLIMVRGREIAAVRVHCCCCVMAGSTSESEAASSAGLQCTHVSEVEEDGNEGEMEARDREYVSDPIGNDDSQQMQFHEGEEVGAK